MTAYLNDERKVDLDSVFDTFANLGAYEQSMGFMLYTNVLTGIESSDYGMIQPTILMMRRNVAFAEYLKEAEIFGTIDELENYAYGRRAEMEGDRVAAMGYYENAGSYRDSFNRLYSMQFAIYEEQYQNAVRAFNLKTYEGYAEAAGLFRELAEMGYSDSVGYLMNSEIMMEIMRPCEHEWQEATCLQERTCAKCGLKDDSVGEHVWKNAECELPKICIVCEATEGKALEHDRTKATCTTPSICIRFNRTLGAMLEHDWEPATTTKPETCSMCGLTRGNPLMQAGDIIRFGSYEQDNIIRNGKEPIEWIVLEVKDGKAFLLSKYGLDAKPYNTTYAKVTWETCTLRKWLNREFYTSAFTNEERAKIEDTLVNNESKQHYYGIYGSRNTHDRLFLLSYAEVIKYFGNLAGNNIEVRTRPTAYAKSNGAGLSSNQQTSEGDWSGSLEKLAHN